MEMVSLGKCQDAFTLRRQKGPELGQADCEGVGVGAWPSGSIDKEQDSVAYCCSWYFRGLLDREKRHVSSHLQPTA